MKKRTLGVLTILAVATGLAAAYAVAPLLHTHSYDPGRMTAMWAHSYKTLEHMARDVDAVVVATVEDTRPGRVVTTSGGAGQLPFTLVDLRIDRAVRGNVAERITVEQTGGDLNGHTVFVDGDGGLYDRGQRVVLFLNRQPDTEYYYLVNPQGRFDVDAGALRAVTPDDPVSQRLDLLPVGKAVDLLHSIR